MITNNANFFRISWIFIVAVLATFIQNALTYTPPSAKVEPLHPQGIRISIPDEHGISLVAFHVNFNEDFYGLDAGTIARDIIKPRNGRWTYQDRTTVLRKDDIVYYWIHVVYNGLGYNLINQEHRVTDFYNMDGSKYDSNQTPGSESCEQLSATWIVTPDGQRKQACQGATIFEDDFDNLNHAKWTVFERFSGPPDDEFVIYRNNVDNINVRKGKLEINPTLVDESFGNGFARRGNLFLEGCTGRNNSRECHRMAQGAQILPPIMSGRMNTKGKFAFIFGRIEVRAKLPRGDWLYPLINLERLVNEEQVEPSYCEIRVASVNGNRDLTTNNGMDIGQKFLWSGGLKTTALPSGDVGYTNRSNLPYRYSADEWANDYHTYEIEWKSDHLTARVDGALYGEQELGLQFNMPYYLNLGLAAGGHTEFPDGCVSGGHPKPWRNPAFKALLQFYNARNAWHSTWTEGDTGLKVDYIKVRAL